jgi:DNA-directed RNA polymerase subunit alpha
MIPLPKSFKIAEKKDNFASFEIEGLYPGYGVTLGNSLRRVLLSSLEGAALVRVKIKGVNHEFSTMEGILEDVITICLNLKKLNFNIHSEEPQKGILKISGVKKVTGKDLKLPSQLDLLNPEQHIATLTSKKANLELEIIIQKGIGYESKEMRDKEKLEIGEISLDATYAPIKKVNFYVENMRVGERTDFDRLVIGIETDGSIEPEKALMEAADILTKHLLIFVDKKEQLLKPKPKKKPANIKKKITKKLIKKSPTKKKKK